MSCWSLNTVNKWLAEHQITFTNKKLYPIDTLCSVCVLDLPLDDDFIIYIRTDRMECFAEIAIVKVGMYNADLWYDNYEHVWKFEEPEQLFEYLLDGLNLITN